MWRARKKLKRCLFCEPCARIMHLETYNWKAGRLCGSLAILGCIILSPYVWISDYQHSFSTVASSYSWFLIFLRLDETYIYFWFMMALRIIHNTLAQVVYTWWRIWMLGVMWYASSVCFVWWLDIPFGSAAMNSLHCNYWCHCAFKSPLSFQSYVSLYRT